MADIADIDAAKGPCGVCTGKFSEHGEGKSHHPWVPIGGDLMTHEEARKKAAKNQPGRPTGYGQQINPLQRLIEVLANKGYLDNGELMYVTGITGEVRHHDGSGATHGG